MKQTKDTFKENIITRRIGSTTYKLKVLFSENATETMEEKILRMVKNESLTKGRHVEFEESPSDCVCLPANQMETFDLPIEKSEICGIIESPQMSRQSERSAV